MAVVSAAAKSPLVLEAVYPVSSDGNVSCQVQVSDSFLVLYDRFFS